MLADLRYFAARYGADPAFGVLGAKPLVIWSGTWKFSRAQVAGVAARVRPRMLLLASEKNRAGYLRLAGLVDGDAYYWSSVDPLKHARFYPAKLDSMSAAIHAHHGLWIAPAAAGFDARLLGGHIVVPRRGGATLRTELRIAAASAPSAIGLISWNEWSENSAIEPSRRYGFQSLTTLAAALGKKFTSS